MFPNYKDINYRILFNEENEFKLDYKLTINEENKEKEIIFTTKPEVIKKLIFEYDLIN